MLRLKEERSSHALPDWCYVQSCVDARPIFHGGVDNSYNKGYANLYLEGGPTNRWW
jgi:hypothetical protein